MCLAKLQISAFVINELNYVLFLKCVEDSPRGLSSNLRIRALSGTSGYRQSAHWVVLISSLRNRQ